MSTTLIFFEINYLPDPFLAGFFDISFSNVFLNFLFNLYLLIIETTSQEFHGIQEDCL